jgi:hypothetical protein
MRYHEIVSNEGCSFRIDEVDRRSVSVPPKPKGKGCRCRARADVDENMPENMTGGRPRFTIADAVAPNCAEASKIAKRLATQKLGMKPKHLKVRCSGDN